MKTLINSLKRTHWFKASMALITCLSFLIFPSCQKYDSNWADKESLNGFNDISISLTSGILYYGHKTFTRSTGAPFVETQKIKNPDFEYFDGNFVLRIQNGGDKTTRVSSAEIKIDGVLVVGPSDFSKNVSSIMKQINGLTSESVLTVKLNSSPGSFIDLWIEGTLKEGIITDIDGNYYHTVKIGDQWWMAENLKTIKYNNGNSIDYPGNDNTVWQNNTAGAYAWPNNDEATYKDPYGALYNWYAVSTGKLCPTGWHVPTNLEWTALTNYLGGENVAGGKLKSTGTIEGGDGLWESPNTGATNETGFTALPSGGRDFDGSIGGVGSANGLWSSTENNSNYAWGRLIYHNHSEVFPLLIDLRHGFSVRCLKD